MLLNKTPKARSTLADRSGTLSALERRVLIICDGQRSLDDISQLLGKEAASAVQRLLADGYLTAPARSRSTMGAALSALHGARESLGSIAGAAIARRTATPRADAAAHPIPLPRPASAPASPTEGESSARRRSVVAAKMYVIGLLQLQRNADAAAQAALLQTCREPEAIMREITAAVAHIAATCNSSYTRRVIDRLEEITPEALLPLLADAQAGAGLRATA